MRGVDLLMLVTGIVVVVLILLGHDVDSFWIGVNATTQFIYWSERILRKLA